VQPPHRADQVREPAWNSTIRLRECLCRERSGDPPVDSPPGLGPARRSQIDELAQYLPVDFACNARTIRRDLEALEAAFPLYTDRVDGRTRWKLVEGFPACAGGAVLGDGVDGDGIHARPGAAAGRDSDQGVARLALSKASAVLPVTARSMSPPSRARSRPGWARTRTTGTTVRPSTSLARAITRHRSVEMRYYSACATRRRDAKSIPITSGMPRERSI